MQLPQDKGDIAAALPQKRDPLRVRDFRSISYTDPSRNRKREKAERGWRRDMDTRGRWASTALSRGDRAGGRVSMMCEPERPCVPPCKCWCANPACTADTCAHYTWIHKHTTGAPVAVGLHVGTSVSPIPSANQRALLSRLYYQDPKMVTANIRNLWLHFRLSLPGRVQKTNTAKKPTALKRQLFCLPHKPKLGRSGIGQEVFWF